jgi:hypothetical protein
VKLWANHKKKILAAMSMLLLGLLAGVAGLVYILDSDDFRVMAADETVRFIEGRTGMETSLERFEIDFRGQTLALVGLEMRGNEDASDPPLISIERVDIGLRWNALITRQIDLTSLEVIRPRFRLEIGDNGTTNVPASPERPEGEPSGFELSIGDLSVSDGQIAVNEERINLDLRLSDFGGSFDYAEETGVLSGHIEWEGSVAWAQRDIPYELSVDFDYTEGVILVQTMDAVSGESRLQLQGMIGELIPPWDESSLAYTGTVDLPFMNHFFADEDFEGEMEVVGDLEFTSSSFSSSGRMSSALLRFDEWTGTDVSSRYSYSLGERVMLAEDFDADVFDGHVHGLLRLLPLPGPSRVELDLEYEDVNAAALRSLYPWGPDYVLDSAVSGTMEGWFRGAFEDFDLSGEAAFRPSGMVTPAAGASLPVAGSTRYRGTPGQVEVDDLDGRFKTTSLEASGVVRAEDFDLTVDVVSRNLSDLAFIDSRADSARGSGSFDGVLSGQLSRPNAVGRFSLEDFDFVLPDDEIESEGDALGPATVTLDRVGGEIDLSSEVVELSRVSVEVGDSRVILDGEVDIQTWQPTLDVEVVAASLSDLSRFDLFFPVTGEVTGQVRVTSAEPVSASGTLRIARLMYDDVNLGTAEAGVTFDDNVIELRNARVRLDRAVLAGDLEYDLASDMLNVALEASGQQLREFRWLGIPEAFQGTVRAAEFVVSGTPKSPLIDGRATIDGLQFREQVFEQAIVNVEHDGSIVTANVDAGDELQIEIKLNTFTEDYQFDGRARFTDYDASRMTGMAPGTVRATGTAEFDGSLSDFETIDGDGRVTELRLLLDDEDIVSPEFPFDFDAEEVRLSSVELVNETTSITIDGDVSLALDSPVDLTIEGEVDLALLSSPLLSPRYLSLDASGILSLNGDIVGNLTNPELEGRATLNSVTIGHPDIFLSLSELNGEIQFNRDQVTLFDVQGVAGGGPVTVGGRIALDGLRPADMELQVNGTDIRVRTPEGLRAVFNADLSIRGTLDSPSVDGNIEVLSLSFEESFDEFLAFFGESAGGGLPSEAGPLDALTLAVHVQGERGIRIENDLARVDARLDLDIGGTLGQPTMTGHVESVDGVLDVQGDRYLITRGTVDFVDPLGIEPRIDVQAETELRDYRIILTLTGTGSDFRVVMSSDPPLPQLEILSLMAGGRTREELADRNGASAVPTSEELFQGAAATMLSDLVSQRVGSRFGLGTIVRIDPFLVGAENDPVARVTVSEQVTRDLIVTYSQDLSSIRQEIILIEYFLDNSTSFIFSRDETGAVGLDIRLRKRFR